MTKYNEQEIKNINEIEELLDKYNEYVSIEPGSSKYCNSFQV